MCTNLELLLYNAEKLANTRRVAKGKPTRRWRRTQLSLQRHLASEQPQCQRDWKAHPFFQLKSKENCTSHPSAATLRLHFGNRLASELRNTSSEHSQRANFGTTAWGHAGIKKLKILNKNKGRAGD